MKTAHDLIMELYAARAVARELKHERTDINSKEAGRLLRCHGRSIGDYEYRNTPASMKAHAAYTEAAHKQAAAMRAVMKYGKEHAE